jgi:hypothetical protein
MMPTELDHPESTNPGRAELVIMRGVEVVRSFDHEGKLIPPSDCTVAQADAYRAGYAAMSACDGRAGAMMLHNPHTEPGEDDLYDAWQAGADSVSL